MVALATCPNHVRQPRLHAARLALIVACLGITMLQSFVLFPEMDYYRLAGKWSTGRAAGTMGKVHNPYQLRLNAYRVIL